MQAREYAAVSLLRAVAAQDGCALQHERMAASHQVAADLLARYGNPKRAAHPRAAA